MQSLSLRFVCLAGALLVASPGALAQGTSFVCGTTSSAAGGTGGQPSSSALSPTGTYRALIVYVRFRDDNGDPPTPCPPAGNPGWLSTQAAPDIQGALLDPDPSPPFLAGSLTDYFHQQSNGNFVLFGDETSYTTQLDQADYALTVAPSNLNIQKIVQEFWNFFGTNINTALYDYDNNGIFDQMIFIFRNLQLNITGSADGLASLCNVGATVFSPAYGTYGGVSLDCSNGSINKYQSIDPLKSNIFLLAHETRHCLDIRAGSAP